MDYYLGFKKARNNCDLIETGKAVLLEI